MTTRIEPGLLNLFRWYVGIRLALLVAVLVGSRGDNPPDPPQFPETGIVLFGALLILLLVPWFQQALGRWFLPIGITLATIAPIADAAATVSQRLDVGLSPNEALADYWIPFFLLFVPFILVAWQYRYRWILVFAVSSTVLDMAVIGGVFRAFSENVADYDVDLSVVGALLLARGVLFAFIGFFIAKLVARQREARVKLQGYAATLEELSTGRERNRMARELHDTLAHSMTGTAIQLEAATALWDDDPDGARALVAQALDGTRSGLAEARRSIENLRASPLEEHGLAGALIWLGEETAAVSGIAVEVHVDEPLPRLPPSLEQAVFRIAEESATNAMRHSQAQKLSINLVHRPGHVILEVLDDGIGFDINDVDPSRHGVTGMQERADITDGTLAVQSMSGAGTTVRYEVPIQSVARSARDRTESTQ